MKTKHITTSTAEILVVELPEGAKNVRINNARGVFGYTDKINIVRWEAIPFGNWKLLGRVSNIAEEQASEMVDSSFTSSEEGINWDIYRNYLDNSFVHTAIESLDSLMASNIKDWGYWGKNRTHLFVKV